MLGPASSRPVGKNAQPPSAFIGIVTHLGRSCVLILTRAVACLRAPTASALSPLVDATAVLGSTTAHLAQLPFCWQELWLIRGPLTAGDFLLIVDATAVLGSTTVALSGILEAAHSVVDGSDRHPLPSVLEARRGLACLHLN